jgi:hypothetical protein
MGGRDVTRFRLGVTDGSLVRPSSPILLVAGLYVGATCGALREKSPPLAAVAREIKLVELFAATPVAEALEEDLARPSLLEPGPCVRDGEVGDGGVCRLTPEV